MQHAPRALEEWALPRLARFTGPAPAGARDMLANAGSLVGSVAVTSLLGFPYWWLAARAFPAAEVGFAATAVSTMTLLGTFGMLGLGTLLTGELSRHGGGREAFIGSGIVVCASAGILLGLGFTLVARPFGLDDLAADPQAILVFTVGVASTGVALVVDQALVGLLRGMLQLHRNIIFSATKLVLLAALAATSVSATGVGIFATWVIGLVVSMAWLAVRGARHGTLRAYKPQWSVVRQWRRPALEHHLLNLAIQGPTLATPLVISATVSVSAAAYFYAASLITGFLAYGAIALTYALYAIGVRDPANLAGPLRFTLRLSFGVIAVANVILLAGAEVILRIFGPDYASHATAALRILAPVLFGLVVKDHYIAINRIRNTVLSGAKICLAGGALELGLAAIGAIQGGLTGFALGALVALVIESFVMAPTLLRELRRPAAMSSIPLSE
jgi:O-antigen/teichoic acid export membrane protein